MTFRKAFVPIIAGLALAATGAVADDSGQVEYMNTCAACHGATGIGDGPLADLMTVPVPDLTQLSAMNDGEFPMLDVIMYIDGRQEIRGHGYPMPIWGDRFAADAGDIGAYGTELEVRGRILSLAYFLESIQN